MGYCLIELRAGRWGAGARRRGRWARGRVAGAGRARGRAGGRCRQLGARACGADGARGR